MAEKQNLYNILKLFCFTSVLTATLFFVHAPHSCAQGLGENAGCATDTWQAMVNQAALETRREDLMNKRYIVKSGSVLQYSCFADNITTMATEIAPIFSGNPLWGNKIVVLYDGATQVVVNAYQNGLSPTSLEEALSLVVDETLNAYITSQFDHEVLSATTAYSAPDPLCYNMSAIWQAAKCKNFDDTQVFYRFEDLIGFDPREFPPNMPCQL